VQQMRVPVVTSWESWKRSKNKSLHRFTLNASGFLSVFTLWRRTLQKIGGNFGGGVQSYFLFLRFLVVLNFVSFLLIGGFVIIPSILFRSVATNPVNKECMAYDPNPQGLVVFYNYFLDLLSGTGFMEYSYLFYGFYNNTMVEESNFSYNIPLAYLFTAVFYFAFCLICIIARSVPQHTHFQAHRFKGRYSMHSQKIKHIISRSGEEGILGLIFEYLPSIVITTGNFVVPFLFKIGLVMLPHFCLMSRSVVLRFVSLGVLLYTLWNQITCTGQKETGSCKLCQYNHVDYPCWETRVGQEMYKLTLFDLLITIAVLILVEFPRRMVVDNWSSKLAQWVGRQEFLVPSNVLGLVYGQTVVWTGALFCPLLPLINTVKFVILFYCKKITLFNNCRPALKTFRSTTSTFFFLVVLLFGWGLATSVSLFLPRIRPSMSCGPFRFFPTIWAIVPTSFYNLPQTTQEFLFFIGSQAFSIPLFILSCVFMCYFIALASVYGKSVSLLRAQLKLEGRDKQFLVKQIEELSRQLQVSTGGRD
uniref:Transmembrane channel-like protein n=1 Tax=Myripristis murdjan TaxID=586833 RepID=A0A667YF49_9TELE